MYACAWYLFSEFMKTEIFGFYHSAFMCTSYQLKIMIHNTQFNPEILTGLSHISAFHGSNPVKWFHCTDCGLYTS